MNKLPLIAGGALAACLAGYFGLSSYSSAQAEKRLEDWVYEHQLDDKLSWSKVSAAPIGSSRSIHDIAFSVGGKEPLLRAAELHISEVISDEQRGRMRLRLQGIEADQQAAGMLDHGSLDCRRVLGHQPHGLGRVDVGLVGFGKLAEGGAAAVEHGFPALIRDPPLQLGRVGAFLLVVVEQVFDAFRLEPGARLLDRVAARNAVEIHAHSSSLRSNRCTRGSAHANSVYSW